LGDIGVTTSAVDSCWNRHGVLRLPIIRGIVALGGSLVIGFRALEVSANAQLPPEEKKAPSEPGNGASPVTDGDAKAEPDEIPKVVWAGTVLVALVFAIVLFFLIPVGLTSLLRAELDSSYYFC